MQTTIPTAWLQGGRARGDRMRVGRMCVGRVRVDQVEGARVTDKNFGPLILLHDRDNVLACRRTIRRGETLAIDGATVVAGGDIEVGHKVARVSLKPGDVVLKYGVPIGSITLPTRIGEHVHMHNMKSDYIAVHTRQSTGRDSQS